MENRDTGQQVPPVGIYYRENSTFLPLGSHFHNHHELILVTGGCGELVIGGRVYRAPRNSLVLISSLEQHEMRAVEYPYKRYVLSVSSQWCLMAIRELALLSILIHRPASFPYVVSLDQDTVDSMVWKAETLIGECAARPDFWLTRASLFLTDILLELYRHRPDAFPKNADDATVRTIVDVQKHIARQYGEEIVLDTLARRYFVSKFQLSRAFKEVTGYNFKEYLILYRINVAKELLCHTHSPITEIAAAVGYHNVNHFIRTFREREGVPPMRYRKLWG